MAQIQVPAALGRSLDVWVEGPPEATPLVVHHGTPSSGLPYPPFVEAATQRGIRWVSYSRPGYGDSPRQPGRIVADCASDVAAILDQLESDRFYTLGGSGGGPHALACAALLPERTIAATTVAGVAPYRAEGLDFLAGMGPENVEEFGAALAGQETLEPILQRWADEYVHVTPEAVADALGGLVSDVDKAVLTGEFAEAFVDSYQEGARTGIWGWYDDDMAFTVDWGLDLASIHVPVTLWQGHQDLMVPPAHGRWLAEHVAGARARMEPDHGHLSLYVGSFGMLLDDMLERAPTH